MIVVNPIPILKKSIITLSFNYHADPQLLRQLSAGCCQTMDAKTILLWCVGEMLKNKFSGSPLDAMRAKDADVCVDVQNNHAIITIVGEPSFSAVRKNLTLLAKYFQPANCANIYKKLSPNGFAHACNAMAKATYKIHVTGGFRVPDGKSFECEIKPDAVKGDMADVQGKHELQGINCHNTINAYFAHDILAIMNIPSSIYNSHVVPVSSSKLETLVGKIDTGRIEKFVEQKVAKLGEKLNQYLVVVGANSGLFTVDELKQLNKITPKEITTGLKSSFK